MSGGVAIELTDVEVLHGEMPDAVTIKLGYREALSLNPQPWIQTDLDPHLRWRGGFEVGQIVGGRLLFESRIDAYTPGRTQPVQQVLPSGAIASPPFEVTCEWGPPPELDGLHVEDLRDRIAALDLESEPTRSEVQAFRDGFERTGRIPNEGNFLSLFGGLCHEQPDWVD
jgi:hypothetical protein